MKALSPREVSLRDPLTEVTRRERRSLLVASVLSIAFIRGGFVPSKISSFGIEFTQTDPRSLLILLSFVVLYFLLGFLLYAASDLISWRIALVASFRGALDEAYERPGEPRAHKKSDGDDNSHAEFDKELLQIYVNNWTREINRNMGIISLSKPVSISRGLFEFLLPPGVAAYAIYALWSGIP
jgi:hypothetical protein